ncbi:MAG: hypothetical protein K0A89_10885 [ANME-2 cluster archaeon]|nr:hypothetical protein [ANME-2 cluster archaeon]
MIYNLLPLFQITNRPLISFTLSGCPPRYAPHTLVVWRTGRRFSILSAGFGREVGMDAFVGGWRWRARIALKSRHLVGYSTLPATAALQGGMVAANIIASCCLGSESQE